MNRAPGNSVVKMADPEVAAKTMGPAVQRPDRRGNQQSLQDLFDRVRRTAYESFMFRGPIREPAALDRGLVELSLAERHCRQRRE